MAMVSMALRVMFRLQMTAGTADRRPKTASGRSELCAYHPEHGPGSYLESSWESILEQNRMVNGSLSSGKRSSHPAQFGHHLRLFRFDDFRANIHYDGFDQSCLIQRAFLDEFVKLVANAGGHFHGKTF